MNFSPRDGSNLNAACFIADTATSYSSSTSQIGFVVWKVYASFHASLSQEETASSICSAVRRIGASIEASSTWPPLPPTKLPIMSSIDPISNQPPVFGSVMVRHFHARSVGQIARRRHRRESGFGHAAIRFLHRVPSLSLLAAD